MIIRKWLKRIAVGAIALLVIVALAGVAFEQWSRWRLNQVLTPPGRIIQVEGRGLHLNCRGEGTPVVILEAGFGPEGSSSWDPVLVDIASVTRVCAYDRAGILWSEPSPKPRSARQMVGELHALLVKAGEASPYVLVGHSLGGPLVLVYADRYPDEVVGAVLVDSSHPQQMERYPREGVDLMKSMMPSPLVLRTLATTGLLRLVNSWQSRTSSEEGPNPAELRFPLSVPGILAEMAALDSILAEAGKISNLGDLPMVVLSAGKEQPLPPGVTVSEGLMREMSDVHDKLQRELATLSTNVDLRMIDDASHYIHRDRPDIVIAAITEMVESVRH